MDATELVQKLAGLTGLDQKVVKQVSDSLIAEIATPQLTETGALAAAPTTTNNCVNNCRRAE